MLEYIEQTTKKKKIKKQKKQNSESNQLHDDKKIDKKIFLNYQKVALCTTHQNLKEIIQQIIGVSSIKINQTNFSKNKKRVILLLDQIDGRQFEDFCNNQDPLMNIIKQNEFYRCTYSKQYKQQSYNFWHNFLKDDEFQIKQEIDYIIDQDKPVDNSNQDIYNQMMQNILNQQQLQQNLFPLEIEGYQKTSSWLLQDKNILSIDCEMVQTNYGIELARISLVDVNFNTVYDKLIKPENQITDYFTNITGLNKKVYLDNKFLSFDQVIRDLQKFIGPNTILIGHSLENDLHALKLIHNKIVDTSVLYPKTMGYKYSLKTLAYNYLKLNIQKGIHDSREDAKIALALAKMKSTILCNFENKQTKTTFEKINEYSFQNQIIIIDTKQNIADFQNSNIKQIIIDKQQDIYEKIIQNIDSMQNSSEFLILARINLNSFGDIQKKQQQFQELTQNFIDQQIQVYALTISNIYNFNQKQKGYDIMFCINNQQINYIYVKLNLMVQ